MTDRCPDRSNTVPGTTGVGESGDRVCTGKGVKSEVVGYGTGDMGSTRHLTPSRQRPGGQAEYLDRKLLV